MSEPIANLNAGGRCAPLACYAPWQPPFRYNMDGQWIEDSKGQRMLDMRGWGYLTGKGSEALDMDEDAAAKIQDAIGQRTADLLNAEVNDSIRPQSEGGSVQCFARLLDSQEADRAKRMPDEQAALNVLFEAWLRLKELGWQEAEYCPKDGSEFKVIEAGSTGFHDCVYLGEWPTGGWWVHDGDTYPSRPILWKPNDSSAGTAD